MQLSQDGLRAFDASGYEIFAEAFAETGEVVIWSRAPARRGSASASISNDTAWCTTSW